MFIADTKSLKEARRGFVKPAPSLFRTVEDHIREEEEIDKISLGPDYTVDERTTVYPSEFAEWGLKVYYDKEYRPFRFNGRKYLKHIYDWDIRLLLLKTSRQVEKSTLLSSKGVASCCMSNGFRVIYVSPSNEQTKTFSRDKLDDVLFQSEKIHPFLTNLADQSLYLKKWKTGSVYMLYYAFHNANRLRGKFGDELQADEFQDLKPDLLHVIEACLHHSKIRRQIRTGTPLTLDNHIEQEFQKSFQLEWVVPCTCTGEETTNAHSSFIKNGMFWQHLTEDNISKKGPICRKCGKRLNPFHPRAHWHKFNPNGGPWWGFHITQLQVPWIVNDENAWRDLYHDYNHMNPSKFRNERLGISDDSAARPITKEQLQSVCRGARLSDLPFYREWSKENPVWMGIDWSPGETESSWDVITMATVKDGKFDVFFCQRITGNLRDPKYLIPYIVRLYREFNVRTIGSDYGMGQDRNRVLVRELGKSKVSIYQYSNPRFVIRYVPELGRYLLNKTEIIDTLFMALRDGYFILPDWSEFAEPHGQDILNIFAEPSEGDTHKFRYSHNGTDDTWHSIVFCYLTSYISGNPSPNVLFPNGQGNENADIMGVSIPRGTYDPNEFVDPF